MAKKKVSKEFKAKHAFGELTLEDILPMVEHCEYVRAVQDNKERNYIHWFFDDDDGFTLYDDPTDDNPEYRIPLSTKVKIIDGHVEMTFPDARIELYFCEARPIKIDIL